MVKRKRRNSVIARRQAIHALAIILISIGTLNVIRNMRGTVIRLSVSSGNTTTIPSKNEWIQKSRQAPIMMHLNGEHAMVYHPSNNSTVVERLQPPQRQEKQDDPIEAIRSHIDTKEKEEECLTMHEWQLPSHGPYSCNLLHEIDSSQLHLLHCGGDRCAYQINDEKLVLKLPKFILDLRDSDVYTSAWMDTISMERLSSSPFTIDIYGNCGISQLTELAESSLFAHIVHARQAALLTSEEQLSIAHHVASGVADMHTAGIAHNDLSPDQFLLVNGIYKISDFHLASFTKQSQNDGTICKEKPQTMNLHLDKARAPEELLYRETNQQIRRDKADVWALGNCLYQILTKRWDFEGTSTTKAKRALLSGKHSQIPTDILHSRDPADMAMIMAMEMAWMDIAEDRPTARQIADYLSDQLTKLAGDPPWKVDVVVPELASSDLDRDQSWMDNYRDESVMENLDSLPKLSREQVKLKEGQTMVIHPL